MVKASGRTFCTVFRLKDGREIVGSLLEISYRSPIAAILFMVAYNMCDWRKFVGLCKTAPKSDIIVLVYAVPDNSSSHPV